MLEYTLQPGSSWAIVASPCSVTRAQPRTSAFLRARQPRACVGLLLELADLLDKVVGVLAHEARAGNVRDLAVDVKVDLQIHLLQYH